MHQNITYNLKQVYIKSLSILFQWEWKKWITKVKTKQNFKGKVCQSEFFLKGHILPYLWFKYKDIHNLKAKQYRKTFCSIKQKNIEMVSSISDNAD